MEVHTEMQAAYRIRIEGNGINHEKNGEKITEMERDQRMKKEGNPEKSYNA